MEHRPKNYKTERARRLGRKAREEIGKRDQMTAPRLQTARMKYEVTDKTETLTD